jgi:hypothetical protein
MTGKAENRKTGRAGISMKDGPHGNAPLDIISLLPLQSLEENKKMQIIFNYYTYSN